jgi:hypothetical protein
MCILRIHVRSYLAASLYFRHESYKIQYKTHDAGMNVSSTVEGPRFGTRTTGRVKIQISFIECLIQRCFQL